MKLFQNSAAKIGGIASALVLFWYVQSNRTISRDVQIRVKHPTLPNQLVFASKVPVYLNVRLSGPREVMDFPLSDFRIHLSNPNPRAGKKANIYTAVLLPELPRGVQAVMRDRVDVMVDDKMTRVLPVDPDFTVPEGSAMRPGYFKVNPPTIRVFGPRSIVSGMERISTREIHVDASLAEPGTGVFRTRKLIRHLPRFVHLAPEQPRDVEFSIRLLAERGAPVPEKKIVVLKKIPFRCEQPVTGFTVRPEPEIQVLLRIPSDRREPEARNFEARAHCPLLNRGKPPNRLRKLPVTIVDRRKRDYIEILSLHGSRVDVHFDRIVVKKSARNSAISAFTVKKRPEPKKKQ